jgi:hypothetical protein
MTRAETSCISLQKISAIRQHYSKSTEPSVFLRGSSGIDQVGDRRKPVMKYEGTSYNTVDATQSSRRGRGLFLQTESEESRRHVDSGIVSH